MVARDERCSLGEWNPDEAAAMAQVTQSLRHRFPRVSAEEIDRVLTEVHRAYDGRPIRHFVPILVEREVTEILRTSRARTDPPSRTRRPRPTRHFAH